MRLHQCQVAEADGTAAPGTEGHVRRADSAAPWSRKPASRREGRGTGPDHGSGPSQGSGGTAQASQCGGRWGCACRPDPDRRRRERADRSQGCAPAGMTGDEAAPGGVGHPGLWRTGGHAARAGTRSNGARSGEAWRQSPPGRAFSRSGVTECPVGSTDRAQARGYGPTSGMAVVAVRRRADGSVRSRQRTNFITAQETKGTTGDFYPTLRRVSINCLFRVLYIHLAVISAGHRAPFRGRVSVGHARGLTAPSEGRPQWRRSRLKGGLHRPLRRLTPGVVSGNGACAGEI